MGTFPVTILLAVVGQHYYATNLTVNTGVTAAQEVWNALVDVKSAYVLVKDCHRRSTTECLRGSVPVNYLCDEKTLGGPYLEVGLADCSILQAEVNLTSTETSVYLSEAAGLVISNITRFNYTNPGGTDSLTLDDVEGVVGLSAMSKMYIQDYVFFHQQPTAALTTTSRRSSAVPMFEWTEDGPVYRQRDPHVQPPPTNDRAREFLPDADLTQVLDSEHHLKSTYSIYDEGMPSVFSLDLQPPSSAYTSELIIGGYNDSAFTGPLQWSEPQLGAVEYPALGFPIFDLRVCDVPLLGTLSSSWMAVPDTLTPCLGLPATAFDSLRAWALRTSPPSVCAPDTSGRYLCRVPSHVSASSLPTVTFSLADVTATTTTTSTNSMTSSMTTTSMNSMTTSSTGSSSSSSGWSEDGGGGDAWGDDPRVWGAKKVSSSSTSSSQPLAVLRIPLGSLLLDADETGARPLCVVRGDNITGGAYDYRDNPIVLGTLPLTQLYMVVDTLNRRVGLANKASTALPSSPQCAAAATCESAQVYDRTTNECLPPRCSDYMFQEIDPDTNLCRFKTGFKVALALLSALAISAELLSHIWRAHIGPQSLHRTLLPPHPSTPRSGTSRGGNNGTNGHRGNGAGGGSGHRNGRWLPSLNREASSGVAGSSGGGGDAGSVGSGSSSPRAWMNRTASDVALLLTGGGAGGRGRRVVNR